MKPQSQASLIISNTPLFSSKRLDSIDGMVICDKYDIYSLGCVLYYMIMDDYLPHPMGPDSKQFKQVLKVYGCEVADLISGMTYSNLVLRYDIKQCLNHPAFSKKSNWSNRSSFNNSHESSYPTNPSIRGFWVNHMCDLRDQIGMISRSQSTIRLQKQKQMLVDEIGRASCRERVSDPV